MRISVRMLLPPKERCHASKTRGAPVPESKKKSEILFGGSGWFSTPYLIWRFLCLSFTTSYLSNS